MALSLSTIAPGNLVDRMISKGLAPHVAQEKDKLFSHAAKLLAEDGIGFDSIAMAYWVPGRVEVVGKHTDYVGGRSLLAAVSKGFCIVAHPRDDAIISIVTSFSDGKKRHGKFELNEGINPKQVGESWVNYPATAARRLVQNFGVDKGLDIAIACDIPNAAGMSTSSAVICYMFYALADRNNLWENEKFKRLLPTKEDLYGYLGCIENGQNYGEELPGDMGVGTFGGSEDHTAIMASEAGKLKMFSYAPTRYEDTIDFIENCTFIIGASGSLAEKTGDKMDDYNNAALLARDGARAYNASKRTQFANLAEIINNVRENSSEGTDVKQAIISVLQENDAGKTYPIEQERKYEPGALVRRFEQFYEENENVVPNVATAFRNADYASLKKFVELSQKLTDTHLRNIIPATRYLQKCAMEHGALAASAFGAGFGGSVWALVKDENVERFIDTWEQDYCGKFPENAQQAVFFPMKPGPAAFRL